MGFGPVLRSCELLSIWRQLKSIVRMGEMRLWGRAEAYAYVARGGPDQPFLLRELRWRFTGKRKTANQVNTLSSPGQRFATGRFFTHWNAGPIAERSFSGYAATFMGWSYPNQLNLLRPLQCRID